MASQRARAVFSWRCFWKKLGLPGSNSVPMAALLFVLAIVAFAKDAAGVEVVRPKVVRVLPHDAAAFTQGLLWFEGYLFESTGQYGRSTLRRVELETGRVAQQVALGSTQFGEGLARVERHLFQLTWRSGVAHRYELDSFERVASFRYDTEGWGLCFDGDRLVMSDGSSRLYLRDVNSFEVLDTVEVQRDGAAVTRLNELECVANRVYANVWQTDRIVVIDPNSGQVEMEVDASGLLTEQEALRADVLNGIAHHPPTGRFYLTGKYWPKVFEVELPAPGGRALPAGAESPGPVSNPVSGGGAGPAATGASSLADEGSSALRVRRGASSCACSSFGSGSPGIPAVPFASGLAWVLLFQRRRRLRLAVRGGGGSPCLN